MKGPKRKSYNEEGHSHLLTFSCYRRQRFFAQDEHRDLFLENPAGCPRSGDESCADRAPTPPTHAGVADSPPTRPTTNRLKTPKVPTPFEPTDLTKRISPV